MKRRYTYYTLLVCLLALGFSSCEMKNELWGKDKEETENSGVLDLKLEVETPSYSGLSAHMGDEALIVPKADDLIVKVFNQSMELQDMFQSYADYLKQSDYLLEKGTYYVEAYSGENYEITSDYPYYEMTDTAEIKAKEVTSVHAVCRLQSAILHIIPTDTFLMVCKDDYAVAITNGTGVLTVGKDDSKIVYIRPGLKTTVTIRATEKKTNTPVTRTFELAGVGGKINPRDLFTIRIKDLEEDVIPDKPDQPDPTPDPDPDPDPEKPTTGGFTIKVDVTLNNNPVDIVVPSTGGDDSGKEDGGDDGGGDQGEAITMTGDAINSDLVVSVPNGIASFQVTIDSPLLPADELAGIGLKSEFDLVAPGSLENSLKELGFPVNIGGNTSASFNISKFIPMLQLLGSGTSKFHLTVTDTKGNTKSKTITVTT